ncbi:MAG: glycerophosphodiester phosphodiesterase [Thermodesulfobacteriota bacterium]
MDNRLENNFLIISHRGASEYEPENTISSFNKAVEMGTQMIEFDIRMSLDRELVVIHDKKVNRTTNGKGYVRDKSLEELRELDAGNGEKIPTADEVISKFANRTKFVIELKEYDTEEKIIDLIHKHNVINDVYIVSFYKRILKRIKYMEPDLVTGLIKFYPSNIYKDCSFCNADVVAVFRSFINRNLVKKVEDNNLILFSWTVNKKDLGLKMKNLGVRGVVTNKPDLLV